MKESEIRAIVRDEMSQLLSSLINKQPSQQEWQRSSKAWKTLNFPSYQQLVRYVQRGFFKEGIHYCDRRMPDSQRPIYYFNIPKCQQLLTQPAAKRK